MITIQTTGGTGSWRWRLTVGHYPVHMGHRHYLTHDQAVTAAIEHIERLTAQAHLSGVPWSDARTVGAR